MKIAFYIHSLTIGGTERTIVNLANELARRGHRIDLLVLDDKGPYREKLSPAINLIKLPHGRALAAFPALVRYMRASKPDIFFAAITYINVITLLARLCAIGSGTAIVVSEQSLFTGNLKSPPRLMNITLAILAMASYPFAAKITCVSAGVAHDLAAYLPLSSHKIKWIHNPVITPETDEMIAAAPADDPWLTSGDTPMIVTCGRLVPAKDYKTLLTAFAALRRRRAARLLILGDGPQMQDLQAIATALGLGSDIRFQGFVTNPFAYMKHASLFVMSSMLEGFCNVIVEALYAGLPVVSTDCRSGPAEILDHGAYGTLVPVGNADALADAMDHALSASVDAARLRQRARAFSVEKICDEYEAVFVALRPGERDSAA